MKCPNCGFESDGRFCPECGTPLKEMNVSIEKVCPGCGQLTDAKFCPNCGHNMNEETVGFVQGEPVFAKERETLSGHQDPEHTSDIPWSGAATGAPRKSHKKIIMIIVIAIAAVLVAAIVALTVIIRGITDNAADWESDSDAGVTTSEEIDVDDFDSEPVTEVETQGKELPGGSYKVGEDIAVGKYNFTYTTEMSENDYWPNDYFYITRAGSEGTEETLGGTKFDERFGSIDYGSAKSGKTFYANLKKGDKLQVDSEFGTWTY